MQKTTLISAIAVGLLVSNVALVAFVWLGNMQKTQFHPQPGGPKKLIIERLHFDEKQVAAYQHLIDQHRAAVMTGDDKIRRLKNELYTTLVNPDETRADSLAGLIAMEQRQMEQVHYHHFADIRKLCRPEQIELFDALAPDLATLFGPPPHRPR